MTKSAKRPNPTPKPVQSDVARPISPARTPIATHAKRITVRAESARRRRLLVAGAPPVSTSSSVRKKAIDHPHDSPADAPPARPEQRVGAPYPHRYAPVAVAANSNTGIAEDPQNGGNGEAHENAAGAESACPIPGRRIASLLPTSGQGIQPPAQKSSQASDVTVLSQVRSAWRSTDPALTYASEMAVTQEQAQRQENPLLEGLQVSATPDPCVLLIFGASGDLTTKKLLPALYSLAFRRLLPERFAILGVARTEETDDEFRERMKEAVKEHARDPFQEEIWDALAEGMAYVATDFADESGEDEVAQRLEELDEKRSTGGNRVYYLAIPPSVFPVVVEALGKRRSTSGWTRLIVEKPFGHDLASARTLNAVIQEHFEEDEVFRIDHYLGKETVQNMLALRFANGIFEPIWNRQFIDHVQITVAESIGIEGRAGYYEHAGAIRDIFQNHLLQLLALTAMEPPIDFTSDSVHNEKVKVLRALHTPAPRSVVRGQYGRGFIEGEEV